MGVGNSAKQSTLAASHGMGRASELQQIRTNEYGDCSWYQFLKLGSRLNTQEKEAEGKYW